MLWSQGPPQSPAVLTISYVKAYFNSTSPATSQASAQQCSGATSRCVVPEDTTHFFDATRCGDGASPSGTDSTRQSSTSAAQPSTSAEKSGAERQSGNLNPVLQICVLALIFFTLWNLI